MIKCKPDEFTTFNPPSGQTCSDWAKDFTGAFGGYIENLNDTVNCRYCQFEVGDQFFLPLNIKFSERWRDAFILFSFFGQSSSLLRGMITFAESFFRLIVFNLIITISEFLKPKPTNILLILFCSCFSLPEIRQTIVI